MKLFHLPDETTIPRASTHLNYMTDIWKLYAEATLYADLPLSVHYTVSATPMSFTL